MPRRNDIAKMTIAVLAASCLQMASAQVSFDSFYAIARTGKITMRERHFASACGVDLSDATVAFGGSFDEHYHWKRVASLGRGRGEAERVTSQESLNTNTPLDGSNGGWLYLQQIDFLDQWPKGLTTQDLSRRVRTRDSTSERYG